MRRGYNLANLCEMGVRPKPGYDNWASFFYHLIPILEGYLFNTFTNFLVSTKFIYGYGQIKGYVAASELSEYVCCPINLALFYFMGYKS